LKEGFVAMFPFKQLCSTLLTASLFLGLTWAAWAQNYKINDRVLAPYGGDMVAATIVGGPNSRGQFRVHFDKTDSQRDKWLAPSELAVFVELGELKPGDLIQAEIMSAWNWFEVVEVKGEEVLCHKPHHSHEGDQWLPKKILRRPPAAEVPPAPWPYPYLIGDFVKISKGGPKPEIGRFSVQGDNLYVGDYRVSDISQILGPWVPRYKVGELVRHRSSTLVWDQMRVEKIAAGGYLVKEVKSGQNDNLNEEALAPDWDYDGFYALAAPLYNDQNPMKIQWLISTDQGRMTGFTVKDAQLKAGLELMSKVEKQIKAKYSQVPGEKDCYECPAQVMDILARRKQVVMKACGMDVETFVNNQIAGYQRHLDDARQQRFWNLPLSFGVQNIAAQVQAELKQNEADLAQDIARNKLIDPAFVFKYDRSAIVQKVTEASTEFARLVPAYNAISSDMGQYSSHDALAEGLASAYVKKLQPQGKILGMGTLKGGWAKATNVSINTSVTQATFSKYLSTRVVVKVAVPGFKYPLAYALTLYNEGKGAYVHPNSVIWAFYKG
jgi:hypothetical protein